MKKIIMIMALATMFISYANAQNAEHKVFCELVGSQKFMSTKITVEVDFGQGGTMGTLFSSKNALVDEITGKKITFNSMIDAMNYMAAFGWEFEQAYVATIGNGTNTQTVYHWLLSKDVKDQEELKDGITTKKDYKETAQ